MQVSERFSLKSVIKLWWTSWQLLQSGSFHSNEWQYGAGTKADLGVGGGRNKFKSFSQSLIIYLTGGKKGSSGNFYHLASSPCARGDIMSCYTVVIVPTR